MSTHQAPDLWVDLGLSALHDHCRISASVSTAAGCSSREDSFNVLLLRSHYPLRLSWLNLNFFRAPGSACSVPRASFYLRFMGITLGVTGILLWTLLMWAVGVAAIRRQHRGSPAGEAPAAVKEFHRLMVSRVLIFLTLCCTHPAPPTHVVRADPCRGGIRRSFRPRSLNLPDRRTLGFGFTTSGYPPIIILWGINSVCGTCRERETNPRTFKKCSGCMSIKYCGAECQRLDWRAHKLNCSSRRS